MIIGITGTDGAGKGAVVQYLAKEKGFTHFSARALITEEIDQRGLVPNRDNFRIVANAMRKELGNDVIVATALQKCKAMHCTHAVIESIRTFAEVETLKANGGILLAIDADSKLRYQRITGRGSASDHVSYEKFLQQETLEMDDPDPHGMQKAKVIAAADFTILNEDTLEVLHSQVDMFLMTVL